MEIFGRLGSSPQPKQIQERHSKKAAAQPAATFSSVIERVINVAAASTNYVTGFKSGKPPTIEQTISLAAGGTNSMIGFKSGELRTPPPGIANSEPAILEWVRRVGVDAKLVMIGEGRVLNGYDLAVLPAPPECWEQLTPAEAAARLETLSVEAFTTMLIAMRPETLPATCVFKTRDGGMGILQVTDFTSEPAGLKVRYKFLDKVPETPVTQPMPGATESWSPTLWPGEKPDLQKILDEAKKLTSTGHFAEALQRYLWHHNHAPELEDSQPNFYALSDWVELGRSFPKAKQALIKIRDNQAREIAAGRGNLEMFNEVQAINGHLQAEDATYALFKIIREKDPKLAQQLYFYVEKLLVAKGEYQWCLSHMGDPQKRFNLIHQSFDRERDIQKRTSETSQRLNQSMAEMNRQHGRTNGWSPPDTSAMMKKSAEDRFVGQTCMLIEILVGTEHKPDAENIRDQAIALLDDPRLKSALEDAEKRIHQ